MLEAIIGLLEACWFYFATLADEINIKTATINGFEFGRSQTFISHKCLLTAMPFQYLLK